MAATACGSFGYKDTAACVIASASANQPIYRVISSGDLLIVPGIGLTKLLVGVYGVKSCGTDGCPFCCGGEGDGGCSPGGELP